MSRKLFGPIAIAFLLTTSAFAQTEAPTRNVTTVTLHGSLAEVQPIYDELSAETDIVLRKAYYRSLSPIAQADLWLLQFDIFLREYPELTFEQRDVILDTVGALATMTFDPSSPGYDAAYAAERLRQLERRASLAFLPDVGFELFNFLGRRARSLSSTTDDCII